MQICLSEGNWGDFMRIRMTQYIELRNDSVHYDVCFEPLIFHRFSCLHLEIKGCNVLYGVFVSILVFSSLEKCLALLNLVGRGRHNKLTLLNKNAWQTFL